MEKKDIADLVNGELLSFQNKITSLYTQNKCVQKILSYDDVSKSEHKDELVKLYGENFATEHIWDGANSFLKKSLELYNTIETYERERSSNNEKNYYKDDDSRSLLVIKSSNEAIIRPSKIESRYKDRLQRLGLIEEGASFNRNIQVKPSKEASEWVYILADKLEYFSNGTKELTETIVTNPMKYVCDVNVDFGDIATEAYTKNQEMLRKYESALNNIRCSLYGTTDGVVCDSSNPSPESPYGQYLAAKEKYENDDYSQAERTKEIAESGMNEVEDMISDYNDRTLPDDDSDYYDSDYEPPRDENGEVIKDVRQPQLTGSLSLWAPQTVLDMLGFISGMKKMTSQYPYVLKGITGLDTAYNKHYGVTDPYLGSGDDKITLTCWESLDLRVSSMFNRYFNAVYDRQYRRERVPVNLRRFNCSIYVHDIRNFNNNYDF